MDRQPSVCEQHLTSPWRSRRMRPPRRQTPSQAGAIRAGPSMAQREMAWYGNFLWVKCAHRVVDSRCPCFLQSKYPAAAHDDCSLSWRKGAKMSISQRHHRVSCDEIYQRITNQAIPTCHSEMLMKYDE